MSISIMTDLPRAYTLIDDANAQDPSGKALPYGRRMSEALARLDPDASEALRLAVRAQHLLRWQVRREDWPTGRAGYLAWRVAAGRHHAERARELLASAVDASDLARVEILLTKKLVGRGDAEAQALEDCACLVTLEYELEEFAAKHPEDKVLEILRKVWAKMSPRARELALSASLPRAVADMVAKALG
jgi:Domain of unknown function (DUF4202)